MHKCYYSVIKALLSTVHSGSKTERKNPNKNACKYKAESVENIFNCVYYIYVYFIYFFVETCCWYEVISKDLLFCFAVAAVAAAVPTAAALCTVVAVTAAAAFAAAAAAAAAAGASDAGCSIRFWGEHINKRNGRRSIKL